MLTCPYCGSENVYTSLYYNYREGSRDYYLLHEEIYNIYLAFKNHPNISDAAGELKTVFHNLEVLLEVDDTVYCPLLICNACYSNGPRRMHLDELPSYKQQWLQDNKEELERLGMFYDPRLKDTL